jgi:hypothetical protein
MYTFQPHCGLVVDQEFSCGKQLPARKADNLTAICEPIV